MKMLGKVIWKDFRIENVFDDIKSSKAYHKNSLIEDKKGIAYVSRSNLNNGLDSVVQNENFSHNPKNTIVFGAENAKFFFQPFEYVTGNKMYYILSEKFNKYVALFIQVMLDQSIKNAGFGYGKGLTATRLKKRSVLLPVTDKGIPDWDFMESYIKEKEKVLIQKYIKHQENKKKA